MTISQYNLRYLRRRFPGSTSRLHLVRNGLELERFPYREPRPLGPTLRVAAVGRLVEKKGFQHLLPAAAELLDQGFQPGPPDRRAPASWPRNCRPPSNGSGSATTSG